MNKDQIKGAGKDALGAVQRKAGEVLNSPQQEAEGAAKQIEGKTQKAYGNVKEAAKDAADDIQNKQQR